ncbi:MAG: glycosyltransferase family 2 protein [Syntrophales bacterium]
MQNRVYIIIPLHNRCELTCRCLNSLRAQTYRNFTTILIDDGSTDGTGNVIPERYPEAIILKGDGNLWWTGAINLGIERALADAGRDDYVLTLNNDTTAGRDYLDTLLDVARKHSESLIGSLAVCDGDAPAIVDGGVRINWATAKFTRLAHGKRHEDALADGGRIHHVDVLPGRGTLIPIEVFRKIGLYDAANLPHYGADYEFSRRARRAGYGLRIVYDAVLTCTDAGAGSGCETERENCWRDTAESFFSIKSPNCIRYRWKFALLTCPRAYLPFFIIFDLCRLFIGTLRKRLLPRDGIDRCGFT